MGFYGNVPTRSPTIYRGNRRPRGGRRTPFSGKSPVPRKKTPSGAPKTPRPVPPVRRPNAEVRGREHLTPAEVEALADVAGKLGRHGLRVTELVNRDLRQVDLDPARLSAPGRWYYEKTPWHLPTVRSTACRLRDQVAAELEQGT